MGRRVQVILDEEEREAFRRQAEREGESLSAWLREAGRRRLVEAARAPIRDVEELRAFFASIADRESDEPEPDWESQREIIESSKGSGRTTT